MPTKTWVVGEEVLAADFNAFVQKQVVATFANAAARDAAIPSATAGMVCYLADTNTMQVHNGTAWQIVPRVGSSGLAYSERVTNTGAVGNVPTEVTDLRLAFTTPGNRRLRVSGGAQYQQSGADGHAYMYLNQDAGGVVQAVEYIEAQAQRYITASRIVTPPAGTHSYSFHIMTTAGTVSLLCSVNAVAFLLVEDLG